MALSPILLLVPAVLMFMRRKKRGPQGLTPDQQRAWDAYGGGWSSQDDTITGSEDGLRLSDRMLLNEDCSGPAAKTVKWRYDARITSYYWYLRRELEWDNPADIAAEMLQHDNPHCQWPPDENTGSEWAWIIWDGTYRAVQLYFDLEQSGELWDYAVDPMEIHSRVKPLVVWAQ